MPAEWCHGCTTILCPHPQAHTCPLAFSASAHASAAPADVLRTGNPTVPSSTSSGTAVWRKINVAEGMGNTSGHRRQRYQTALGSARETLACAEVAQAMRYVGKLDPKVIDRMNHVVATLTRLVHCRA